MVDGGAEMHDRLRRQALGLTPRDLGIPPPGITEAYGVLMEFRVTGNVITLTSFASGDASLYFGTGGGVLGGVGHAAVRTAAQRFVDCASARVDGMQKTEQFPVPAEGMTRFYVLTGGGVVSQEVASDDLIKRRSALSDLFFAANDVITQLRLIAEKKR